MKDPLKEFATAASDFCSWCESEPATAVVEARTALQHLPRLYLLAHGLRELHDAPEVDGDRPTESAWRSVFKRFAALPVNYYYTVSDPLQIGGGPPDCTIGDLADDLADIWRDLSDGLSLFRLGHLESAEWEWAFSFRTHWGKHAVDAMRSLHVWFAANGVS
ncbi:MAG: DUF5063 domain-containing protein [Planctomycetes bacterium]|nr:DUF5063 domain-containing protein [Planctomycetota bacterium]